DSITSSNSNIVKLLITNNSASSQNIALTMKGGYITNTIQDIIAPSTYSEITLVETPSTNTYFCKTNDTLTQGLQYVNGQYTYAYKQEGGHAYGNSIVWSKISNNGWGVQLTDKTSTDAVTSKVCTYINNVPIISMSYMFSDSKATTINLSNLKTSNIMNMQSMFYYSKATTLDLSNFDTSKVTNMNEMFSNTKATTLDISNFDTSKVTNMECMFSHSQAATIDISNFDTSNVTNMYYMFGYSQATTLDVSKFNTSKVTTMQRMFYNSQATTIDVSNFDTSKVTNMNEMFSHTKATTLDLSNFNTSNVTDMSYMFEGSQATILDVSSFDTSKVTNMRNMFNGTQATTLDLSNFNTSNVTNMTHMFSGTKATIIDVSNFDTSKVTNMFSMFYGVQTSTLDVSNFNTSNVTDMSMMFYKSQMTILDVSNFDTSKVTDISYMFRDTKATTLDVSNFDTSKVKNMSFMFYGSQVATLDISNFDTSNVTNMSYMFSDAANLKTIYASNKFNTTNATNSSKMFQYAFKLVGGAGTKYNSSYIDKTYAHIDGGTSNPGYFTSIPEPNSFSTDSWMTIAKAVKSGNISKYNVGDTRTINMGTYGTHTLRIANTSTWSKCSTSSFSQSACGFVLEFTDIITTHNINPSGVYNGTQYDYGWNKDGWPASSMYAFVNNDIYNALPSDLRNVIINTRVISGHGSEDTENFTSIDKLYLLSFKEIYSDYPGTYSVYDTATNQTKILDYYKKQGVTITNNSGAIKKNGTNVYSWWLRANGTNSNSSFGIVYSDGRLMDGATSSTYGVSPAFRIG
ncbi:MAG: BspA family leucine-rich repeat surface protein, partial [Clostridium sp.]|nr:BspA family leucine-rich repeat surface protein [Clostridium sp.]